MKKLLVYTSFLMAVFVLTSTISYSEVCSPGLIKAMKEEGLTNKQIKLICEKAKLYDEFSTVKQSAVEGKLVDWNLKPVAGAHIFIKQVQPIKGYERFKTVTNSDGTFRIEGLYPSSVYVLSPWHDKWEGEWIVQGSYDISHVVKKIKINSAPQGETAILKTIKIVVAHTKFEFRNGVLKKGGSLVIDLATGAERFIVSPDGVILDSKTNLEWIVGPDKDSKYAQASQWVASCKTAGGGWRMPTPTELRALYLPRTGTRRMDPYFKTTGWRVWSEPHSSSESWYFSFSDNRARLSGHKYSGGKRGFAVRSRR